MHCEEVEEVELPCKVVHLDRLARLLRKVNHPPLLVLQRQVLAQFFDVVVEGVEVEVDQVVFEDVEVLEEVVHAVVHLVVQLLVVVVHLPTDFLKD